MFVGGYLGGHLTFVKAVNVNHTAWPAGPDAWTQVCAVADPADGTPRKVDAAGVPILLTAEVTPSRRSMPPALTWADRWPTANSPRLRNLPWYGSTFRLADGDVVRGPATIPQPCYDTRVRDGHLEVRARH